MQWTTLQFLQPSSGGRWTLQLLHHTYDESSSIKTVKLNSRKTTVSGMTQWKRSFSVTVIKTFFYTKSRTCIVKIAKLKKLAPSAGPSYCVLR